MKQQECMHAIKIESLTKYYGKFRGIEQVSLVVEPGEFFGFIGPNGAGKSTTIRTLMGLIKATAGSAAILGMDIEKDKEDILAKVGYLPSEAIFYSGMKVKDVLKLSADLRKQNCKDIAEELCQRLQLDVTKKVEELSFGNRKKVGIVCALQHNPELLILDEPTSGLDPLMQKEFFEILKERNRMGTTVFLSSHVLSEIQNNCSQAAIIREGRIVACDSVEALSKTNAKRVVLRGIVDLDGLEGIRNMQHGEEAGSLAHGDMGIKNKGNKENRRYRNNGTEIKNMNFLYSGDLNQLLQRLAVGQVFDLSISDLDLDEIFMHYYEQEGKYNDDDKA